MTDIYTQHDKAFSHVNAFVISKDGEKIATIAFKYPRDGAGRLWVYIHWVGLEMVRGYAGGYGYDKKSAACANAMVALRRHANAPGELEIVRAKSLLASFIDALDRDRGQYWNTRLTDVGFTVWQAV